MQIGCQVSCASSFSANLLCAELKWNISMSPEKDYNEILILKIRASLQGIVGEKILLSFVVFLQFCVQSGTHDVLC